MEPVMRAGGSLYSKQHVRTTSIFGYAIGLSGLGYTFVSSEKRYRKELEQVSSVENRVKWTVRKKPDDVSAVPTFKSPTASHYLNI
jgi:hypothetical protein